MRRFLISALATALFVLVAQTGAQSWQIPKANGGCRSTATDVWSLSYPQTGYIAGGGTLTTQLDTGGVNQPVVEIDVLGHQIGAYYVELTGSAVTGSDLAFGFASCTHANTTSLGFTQAPAHPVDSIGYQFYPTNRHWCYNDACGPQFGPSITDGHVYGLAINLTLGGICIRDVTASASTWYGSGSSPTCDPATNTNMYPFNPPSTPWFVGWASNFNGSTHEGAILNPAGSFAATAPPGYGPWQP